MSSNRFEVPELFPQPKSITSLGGESELAADVRLVTNDVSPLQRKAICSILASAGVRVVANKKKYVVDAKVESAENFDLKGIPAHLRGSYYELTIRGSEVKIRAPEQEGTVWASQTLATLFRLFLKGHKFPNLLIRDWCIMPWRGFYLPCTPGVDHLAMTDGMQLLDLMSASKLNLLILDFYQCDPVSRFDTKDASDERLLVPVPGKDDWKTFHHLEWYNVAKNCWVKETYAPVLRETEEALPELLNYGAEKGIVVVPSFPGFDSNSFLARAVPALSAKNASGKPLQAGICTTSREARAFLEQFYTSFLAKYFPTGLPFLHIGLGDFGAVPCKCKACKGKKPGELLQDYVLWLAGLLTAHGVEKVVFRAEALQQAKLLESATFAKKVASVGLKGKLVVQWKLADAKAAAPAKLGWDCWLSPIGATESWSNFSSNLPAIANALEQCRKKKLSGTVVQSDLELSNLDQAALMGAYAWEESPGSTEAILKRWLQSRLVAAPDKYLQGVKVLAQAAAIPELQTCLYVPNARLDAKGQLPPYPEAALLKLEKKASSRKALQKAFDEAGKALAILEALTQEEGLDDLELSLRKSLLADCARVQAVASTFLWMLTLREELKPGTVMKRMVTSANEACNDLAARMKIVEQNKPSGSMPATMHALGQLYQFLLQLADDLKARATRKQANQIAWTILPVEETSTTTE